MQGSSRTLALYSWHPRGQPWHYVLVPDNINSWPGATKIMQSPGVMVGETALKRRLASFPAGKSIPWRDDPPRYVLTYPPRPIVDDAIHFADAHHVYLYILPTIYE
jgi:hypothetical protein